MHTTFTLKTTGQGLYEFTGEVEQFIAGAGIEHGLLTLFVRHTSCSLTIQENADGDVQKDLHEFFARLVPEGMDWLRHTWKAPTTCPPT